MPVAPCRVWPRRVVVGRAILLLVAPSRRRSRRYTAGRAALSPVAPLHYWPRRVVAGRAVILLAAPLHRRSRRYIAGRAALSLVAPSCSCPATVPAHRNCNRRSLSLPPWAAWICRCPSSWSGTPWACLAPCRRPRLSFLSPPSACAARWPYRVAAGLWDSLVRWATSVCPAPISPLTAALPWSALRVPLASCWQEESCTCGRTRELNPDADTRPARCQHGTSSFLAYFLSLLRGSPFGRRR